MLDAIAPLVGRIAEHDLSLSDQLRRAAQSVTLNLAEATGHRAGNRRLRLESALGSTYETRAALRVARTWGYLPAEQTDPALTLADRVAAMTYRLLHPRP